MVPWCNCFLYTGNANQAQLQWLNALQHFTDGALIIGEDLNLTLDALLDLCKTHSHLSYPNLYRVKQELHLLFLVNVNVWCIHNPNGGDYTFYSPPQKMLLSN